MQTVSRAPAFAHPLDLPAMRIAAGIRSGEFSAELVVAEALRRARRVNERLNAFTLLREEAALAAARDADRRAAAGGDASPFSACPLPPRI